MQAERLDRLRLELLEDGITDVSYGVINVKGLRSRLYLPELKKKVTFNVYQDTPRKDVWGLLDGRKDDFIVYDRCGRLARHIRMPEAYLARPDVENAIREVYAGSPCGPCATTPAPQDTTPTPVFTTPVLPTDGAVLTTEPDGGSGDMVDEFIRETTISDLDVRNTTLPTSSILQNRTSVNNVTESAMFTEHNHTTPPLRNHTHHHHHHRHHHHHGHDHHHQGHTDHGRHGHGSQ